MTLANAYPSSPLPSEDQPKIASASDSSLTDGTLIAMDPKGTPFETLVPPHVYTPNDSSLHDTIPTTPPSEPLIAPEDLTAPRVYHSGDTSLHEAMPRPIEALPPENVPLPHIATPDDSALTPTPVIATATSTAPAHETAQPAALQTIMIDCHGRSPDDVLRAATLISAPIRDAKKHGTEKLEVKIELPEHILSFAGGAAQYQTLVTRALHKLDALSVTFHDAMSEPTGGLGAFKVKLDKQTGQLTFNARFKDEMSAHKFVKLAGAQNGKGLNVAPMPKKGAPGTDYVVTSTASAEMFRETYRPEGMQQVLLDCHGRSADDVLRAAVAVPAPIVKAKKTNNGQLEVWLQMSDDVMQHTGGNEKYKERVEQSLRKLDALTETFPEILSANPSNSKDPYGKLKVAIDKSSGRYYVSARFDDKLTAEQFHQTFAAPIDKYKLNRYCSDLPNTKKDLFWQIITPSDSGKHYYAVSSMPSSATYRNIINVEKTKEAGRVDEARLVAGQELVKQVIEKMVAKGEILKPQINESGSMNVRNCTRQMQISFRTPTFKAPSEFQRPAAESAKMVMKKLKRKFNISPSDQRLVEMKSDTGIALLIEESSLREMGKQYMQDPEKFIQERNMKPLPPEVVQQPYKVIAPKPSSTYAADILSRRSSDSDGTIPARAS